MRLYILFIAIYGLSACQFKGKTYSDEEEWIEKDVFKMKCKVDTNGSWRTEVIACITPDKDEVGVPVNGSTLKGDHEWECKITKDGQITLKQTLGKSAPCQGGHKHGTVWTEKSFQFKCADYGITEFLGCISATGIMIPSGKSEEVSGYNMECKKHENGTITLTAQDKAADADCVDHENKPRKKGEKWIESGHFEKSCEKHGVAKVTGCKVDGVVDIIPLNSKVTKGNMDYHCEGKDGSYKFFSKMKE
uniref:Sushi domain-containing protein n=1 Tax=Heterorhabditis bacteriophora TaxID=37862 RepID=A0A1I7XL98_HETBA